VNINGVNTKNEMGVVGQYMHTNTTRSLWSVLSGKPDDDDYHFRRVHSRIENGKYSTPLCVFSSSVQNHQLDHYDVAWVKSPNGVYTVIHTMTPIKNKTSGVMDFKPSFSVVFCTHPHYLANLALWKKEGRVNINRAEFNRKMTVVRTHLAEDIALLSEGVEQEEYQFAWSLQAMRDHRSDYEKRLLIHGCLVKDNEFLYRSGSSVFWLEQSKSSSNLDEYHVHYYSNPVQGQTGLFVSEEALEKKAFRVTLRAASIKLTDAPIKLDESHEFIRESFASISNKLVRFGDPYDLYPPITKSGKALRFLKKSSFRTIQQIVSVVANTDFKSVGMKAGMAGLATIGFALATSFVLAGTAAAIALLNSNKYGLLMRSMQKSFRAVSQVLNISKEKRTDNIKDYSASHAEVLGGNIYVEDAIGLPLNAEMCNDILPVPIERMGITFADAKPYNDKHERLWAESTILNTKGYSPGTVFSEIEYDQRNFLHAEQANGMHIYYYGDRLAYARLHGPAYEHACLEVPIERRFKEMEDGNNYVEVRFDEKKGLVSKNLPDMKDGFKGVLRKQPSPKIQFSHHLLEKYPIKLLPVFEKKRVFRQSMKVLRRHMGVSHASKLGAIFKKNHGNPDLYIHGTDSLCDVHQRNYLILDNGPGDEITNSPKSPRFKLT